MSICDEGYNRSQTAFPERVTATISQQIQGFAQALMDVRDRVIRNRRLHATESVLDSLPEGIRQDIGWPDLYERQVQECNEMKRRSN